MLKIKNFVPRPWFLYLGLRRVFVKIVSRKSSAIILFILLRHKIVLLLIIMFILSSLINQKRYADL